jgi:hypothetical protein
MVAQSLTIPKETPNIGHDFVQTDFKLFRIGLWKYTYNIFKMFPNCLLDDNEQFFQLDVKVYENAQWTIITFSLIFYLGFKGGSSWLCGIDGGKFWS